MRNQRTHFVSRIVKPHSDTVPVFINHHHTQEHAEGEEEQSIDVVFNSVADRYAESEQENLGNGEESGTEDDVTDGPPVVEGAEYEDKLGNNIDNGADKWPKNIDYPKPDRLVVLESGELLECGDGDEE